MRTEERKVWYLRPHAAILVKLKNEVIKVLEENVGEFTEILGMGRECQAKLKSEKKMVFLYLTILDIKLFNIIK